MNEKQKALMKAIFDGKEYQEVEPLINDLTNNGRNPEALDFEDNFGEFGDVGSTILHIAAENSIDYRITAKIISVLPSLINKSNVVGWMPIHTAAIYENPNNIGVLMKGGANLKAKDLYNRLFIDYLRREQVISCVRQVYNHGKSPEDFMPEPRQDDNWYGFSYYITHDIENREVRLKHLAMLFVRTKSDEYIRQLINAGGDVDGRYFYNGATMLLQAARMGDLQLVRKLLDMGVNDNIINNSGDTALILASSNGYLDIVKELLDRNDRIQDINAANGPNLILSTAAMLERRAVYINKTDKFNVNALKAAILDSHLDVIRELINRGADINMVDDREKQKILALATARGDETIKQELMNHITARERANAGMTMSMVY